MQRGRPISPLREIPGIGPSIAAYLAGVGIREVADLKGRDPEAIYEAMCRAQGVRIDRCLLYVCRLAVYYASAKRRDPAKLKWWLWKDHPPAKKQR